MLSRVPRSLLGFAVGGALVAGVALSASSASATDLSDHAYRIAPVAQDSPLDPARLGAARRAVPGFEALDVPPHPGAVPGSLDVPAAAATAFEPVEPVEPVEPTTEPTVEPTTDPTVQPTVEPTVEPTVQPTVEPTVEPTVAPTNPPADTTAPTGSFKLSTTALWIGQRVTLTQTALADDTSAAHQITRTVDWGDGSPATTLAPGDTRIAKAYKPGRYTVSVTLTDAAGNKGSATVAKPTIDVTVPGAFKLSKKAVWHHESFKTTITKVPNGTKKITVDWGDGYVSAHPGKNQTILSLYYTTPKRVLVKPGVITLRATFTNANGVSAPIVIGKITLKRDSADPTVRITKPAKSKANRLSSWKTVRGTMADRGSGVGIVWVYAVRFSPRGDAAYCYTPTKKWKRVYSEAQMRKCPPAVAKLAKGKWSLPLNGLKKGTLFVDAIAGDWSHRFSKWASVSQKITR